MNPDILRQLIWRHESKLHALTRELVGPSGVGMLRSASGRLLWSNRPELVPTSDSETLAEAPSAGGEGTQTASSTLTSTEVWTIPIGEYGALELHPSSSSTGAGEPVTEAQAEPTGPVALGSYGEVLPSLGALLAVFLESEEEYNQLVEDHISNTNQLVALYNIISRTHETWDVDEKLMVIIEEAGMQTGAAMAALRLETEVISSTHYWPHAVAETQQRADALLAAVHGTTEPISAEPPSSHASVPILQQGTPIGWLVVADRFTCEPFQIRDLKLLGALAELTAGFLLTSKLQEKVLAASVVQRELSIASDIQEMLMPRKLPELAGFECAAACVPARSVGGDFYVVQKLKDDRCAFAIGDVTGKGVPAALIMAMTRTVFRSLGSLELGPREIIQRMSEVLFDDLEGVGKFVTMIAGTYDLGTRRIEVANAGHSPVLYSEGSDAPFRVLEPPLPPLGVLEDMRWEPLSLEFPPEAMLVLCSDGITEARNVEGEMYEQARLEGVLEEHRGRNAEHLLRAVLRDVDEFSKGAPQSDDQTLLICRGKI